MTHSAMLYTSGVGLGGIIWGGGWMILMFQESVLLFALSSSRMQLPDRLLLLDQPSWRIRQIWLASAAWPHKQSLHRSQRGPHAKGLHWILCLHWVEPASHSRRQCSTGIAGSSVLKVDTMTNSGLFFFWLLSCLSSLVFSFFLSLSLSLSLFVIFFYLAYLHAVFFFIFSLLLQV